MKIVSAGARLFLNRSAKNMDGGWTKGEMELTLEAALDEGDDPDAVQDQLIEQIRKKLYQHFKVGGNLDADQRKRLESWGRKQAEF